MRIKNKNLLNEKLYFFNIFDNTCLPKISVETASWDPSIRK